MILSTDHVSARRGPWCPEPGFQRCLRRPRSTLGVSVDGERAYTLSTGLASCNEKKQRASRLLRDRYAWRGYHVADVEHEERRATGTDFTLVAEYRDRTAGTLTIGLDGSKGLLAERGYSDVIATARDAGSILCELTRLAVAEWADGKAVMAALFQAAYTIGRQAHGVTHAFVEVNPRHASFYRRAFGFVMAANERFCERAKAPSVLLLLDLSNLDERLKSLAGSSV